MESGGGGNGGRAPAPDGPSSPLGGPPSSDPSWPFFSLLSEISTRIGSVDNHVSNMDKRMSQMDARHHTDIVDVRRDVSALHTDISDVRRDVSGLSNKVGTLSNMIAYGGGAAAVLAAVLKSPRLLERLGHLAAAAMKKTAGA